jgi:hypothetical protein
MAFVRMMAVQGRRCIIALSLLLVAGAAEAASSARALSHERPVVVVARGSGPALCGLWGDVNDDGQVGSVDALITLQSAVGLPVPDPARVAVAGDVNNDGQVNSADALAILQYVVGLGAGTTRVGQQICAVASVTVTPGSATIAVGATAQLTATLRDAQGNVLTGHTVTWSSSDAAKASVSPAGLVTGLAVGSATITALSEGVSGSAVISVSGPPPPPPGGQANVIVDPLRTFQTHYGWSGLPVGDMTFSVAGRDQVIDKVVNELGLTYFQLDATHHIEGNGIVPANRGGAFVNDNADPNTLNSAGFTWTNFDSDVNFWLIPFKNAVEAAGNTFRFTIKAGSASATSNVLRDNPAEYAEHVSAILSRLKTNYSVPLEPDTWEINNEPDNAPVWTGAQIGAIIKATGDRARAEGYSKIMFTGPGVTDATAADNYFAAMMAVAGASQYIAELTYHIYRSSQTVANLNAIRTAAGSRRTFMTEFIGYDQNMLYLDLTQANLASAIQYTLAAGAGVNDAGGTYYNTNGTFSGGVATQVTGEGSRTRMLRQYFRHIRPGMIRVAATSTDAGIKPVAYRAANGKLVVVANATAAKTLTINLPAGTYQVRYATAADPFNASTPDIAHASGVLTASIPAAGVISVIQR